MRKYIQIDMSEQLHRDLKSACSKQGYTIKGKLILMIEEYIENDKSSKMGMPYDDH